MSPHTLLITGANSGFGLSLTLLALRQGHKVISTARNVPAAQSSSPEVEQAGGIWLQLDVTSPSAKETISIAVREHGINVVVNNAGFALMGPLEDWADEAVRHQFETNVFGAVRVMQGAIPVFRERRAGTIVNVSSTAGLSPLAAASLYSGSKYALEGECAFYYFPLPTLEAFVHVSRSTTTYSKLIRRTGITEALRLELSHFNIRVLLVNPGAFRTRFLSGTSTMSLSEPYRDTPAGKVVETMRAMGGKQGGDPEKGAARMLELITRTGLGAEVGDGMRLLLGPDALARMETKLKELNGAYERNENVARSTDLEG